MWEVAGMTVSDDPDMHAVDVVQDVTALQCSEIRRRILAAAVRAGLSDDQAWRFTLAVNEVVINAVTHGGGRVTVAIQVVGSSLVVEVQDSGGGVPSTVAAGELPPSDAVGGRGIWLAREFCDDLTIHNRDTGALVRLVAVRQSSSAAG
jgi:serine/threonine-protein kinase RsbW